MVRNVPEHQVTKDAGHKVNDVSESEEAGPRGRGLTDEARWDMPEANVPRKSRRRAMPALLASTVVAVVSALCTSVVQAHSEVGAGTLDQPRNISVTMTDDLRLDPAEITVGAAEVVRFALDNPTAAAHDFLVGDLATQEAHDAEMAAGMMQMHGACPASEGTEHMDEAAEHRTSPWTTWKAGSARVASRAQSRSSPGRRSSAATSRATGQPA